MHEYTISKIRIYKSDPIKWKAAIREVVDGDNLPKYWGGDMVDPDGDPRCPSKVIMFDLSRSYYLLIVICFYLYTKGKPRL